MEVIRTIPPGKKGSIRFLKEWGDQLVTVRYRKNHDLKEILTTIEIVVDRRPIAEPGAQIKGFLANQNQQPVAVKIYYQETELRNRIKEVGALWSNKTKLWVTKRETAVSLGLLERIIKGAIEQCTDVDTSFL